MTNRITSFVESINVPAVGPAPAALPAGFAVCQLPHVQNSSLAIQLLAQQQAYEQALIAAREDALRIALSRLQMSLN